MSFRRVLEQLPPNDWKWTLRILISLVVFAVLFSACLVLAAYIQNGIVAGYAFGRTALSLPPNIVIMMEQECTSVKGWVPYTSAKGRIPVGAGTGMDINGVGRTFSLEDDDIGEYVHTLSVEEMPTHSHKHPIGGSGGRHRCDGGCNNLGNSRATDSTGGSQPHNNMPPTFTMNFCVQAP